MSKQEGFTLLEMLIAMGIMGLLAAIAMPTYAAWRESARYRDAARSIASALREARTAAISRNCECRVEFDIDGGRYRVTHGDLAYGSSDFSAVLRDWRGVGGSVLLRGNKTCGSDVDLNVQFNPNGTGNSRYICIMDKSSPPVLKFRVGIPSSTTGRVIIEQ